MTHKLETETFSQKIEHSGGVILLPLTPLFSFVTFHLKQIPNATVFNFKYFSSGISYQAYFSYVSDWRFEVSFRQKINFKFMSGDQF